jgi:hypothetical protein
LNWCLDVENLGVTDFHHFVQSSAGRSEKEKNLSFSLTGEKISKFFQIPKFYNFL